MTFNSFLKPYPGHAFALVAFLCLIGFLPGCGGHSTGSASPMPSPSGGSVATVDHVFLLVLENHSFSNVIGSPHMTYLNSLVTEHSLAINHFANAHPSIPNYFMLSVGLPETFDDNFSGMVTDDNVVRALSASGKTWKAYVENLPFPGYTGNDVPPLYLKHHNPFAYLSDVLNSSMQAANIVPFSQLLADLNAGTLPNFGFIVPNSENDAHTCPGAAPSCADSDRLTAADTWLKNNIDPVINSPAFGNSVFIITWDESTQQDFANGGGHVATLLLGAHVKAGFRSASFYQHQSTLRLVLDLLNTTDLPNTAAIAPSMAEFFQ